ncbi:MAG: Ca-activated chloride channel family protein [Candidatus Azotimanducaceae bacterium]
MQPVDYDRGTFSFRFPMTITPRCMPETPMIGEAAAEMDLSAVKLSPNIMGWALATTRVPDASLISPPMSRSVHGEVVNPVSLSVSLDPGLPLMEVSSDYHDISVKKEA